MCEEHLDTRTQIFEISRMTLKIEFNRWMLISHPSS